MDLSAFRASLNATTPPVELSTSLQALWWAAQGDWHRAHNLVQDDPGAEAAWVHAYLHRQEGDLGNAAYWYRRARQPVCTQPLDDEWEALSRALLAA